MLNWCKNFVMVTTSYICDKKCPYCIAKMDNLQMKEEDLKAFKEYVFSLKEQGFRFKYFILSGNGEPSFYSFEFLRDVKEIVESSGIFEEKRIQSSGHIFFEQEKFDLFKDWIVEITRVSLSPVEDMRVLGYIQNYMQTENYKKAKLRVNIVLLKNSIFTNMLTYFLKQSNVHIVALKILDNVNNPWITENGVNYTELSEVLDILMKRYGKPIEEYTNYLWNINDKLITLFNNKDYMQDKTIKSVMWYGNSVL